MRRGGLGGWLESDPQHDEWMVIQILADAGEILDHVDPKRTKRGYWADPRTHKDGRGVKRPSAEADLTPLVFCLSVRGSDTDARRASSGKDNPIHEGIAEDGEVGAIACRLKIAIIRRHAPTGPTVHGVRGYSGAVGRVMVLCPRIAQIQRRRTEGTVEVTPLFDRCSGDRDWSPTRMVGSLGEVEIILKLAKGREHIGP
jgi:hypothetical protein